MNAIEARTELIRFLNEELDGYESDRDATSYLKNAFPYNAAALVRLIRQSR